MRIFAFLSPIAVSIRVFLKWWLTELYGLLPGAFRKLLDPGIRCLAVHVAGESLVACKWEGSKGKQVAEVRAGDAKALQAAVARHRRKDAKLVLCLPRERALFKEITLPVLPQAELRRALYYQIDRQTPFAASEVCFDHVVLEASPSQLRVLMAVVPKRVVEHETQRLAGLGIRAAAVAVADPGDVEPPVMNLRSGFSEETSARSFADVLNAVAAAAACGLIVATGYLAFEEREAAAAVLAGQVQGARRAADDTAKLEKEIALLRKDLTFFADRKRKQPLATSILLELTHILPDHTWLTELQYKAGEVRLAGHSAAAADLIALIDGSELFAEPRFRSPVTPDPVTGKERFNLTFQITPRGEGGGKK